MTADVLMTTGNDIRENLVTTAVKFLQNPKVQRCTMDSKERFLRSKGLSGPEVQKAIEKCMDSLDVQSMTSELMFYHQSRSSWFRDHVVPVLVYGGFVYGCYWFYKNCIRRLLFIEEPKRKSTVECLDDLRKSLDMLNTNVTSLRGEMQASAQHNAMRAQLDTLKSDIASVKGILLNKNQFPSIKTRSEPPSIPAWQRQSEEATSSEPVANDDKKPHRPRSHRSESGGSNSSEGEQATKNSDSSLEIINKVKMTDKPVRPMSAYMLWLNSARETIKAEHPGLRVTEIAKKGGEMWRGMKDKDKSVWEEKAAKAKEQYRKDLESYNAKKEHEEAEESE